MRTIIIIGLALALMACQAADGLHRRVQSTLACEHFTSLQPNDTVDDARGLVDVRADENAVMIAQEARA